MSEFMQVDRDARGVATLWLARVDKHNALSAQMLAELETEARALGGDETVRVVVLAARGRTFCAGGDLAWMRAQFDMQRENRRVESARIAQALGALYALPQPLIGRVQGNAFGGGLGLMSVCDLCIGVNTAKFGFTETRLGLIPANIGPYVIARMGAARAQRVFMNGRIFGAEEAVSLDLLARHVADDRLDAEIEHEVAPYLDCAPGAVRDAKALVRQLSGAVDPAMVEAAIDKLAARWDTDEAQTGIAAFFDKTDPPWRGGTP